FRWRVDSVERVGDYSEEDVQRVRAVLEDVSEFCSRSYASSGYCPEDDPPAECMGEVDTLEGYFYRSSDADVVLFLDEANVEAQGGDVRFRGFTLMPEHGGWPSGDEHDGWTFHYLRCDEPRAPADGRGPG